MHWILMVQNDYVATADGVTSNLDFHNGLDITISAWAWVKTKK